MKLPPPPELSDHPVDKGQRTEAAVISRFVQLGYGVLLPFGVNHRYDLVLDARGSFLRVQCKTGRFRNGCVEFSTRSTRVNSKGAVWRDYLEDEIDLFAVHCPEIDRFFAVPIEVAPRGHCSLRIDAPANSQAALICWARDYEVVA